MTLNRLVFPIRTNYWWFLEGGTVVEASVKKSEKMSLFVSNFSYRFLNTNYVFFTIWILIETFRNKLEKAFCFQTCTDLTLFE